MDRKVNYKKFTLKLNKSYGLSRKDATGKFLPIQLAKVIAVDKVTVTLEFSDGSRITIFR